MRNDAFQTWRREREAVEQEMDLLITAGLPASNEERQIRRTRFAALLERRETAARNLLHSGWARRTDKSPSQPSPSQPSPSQPSRPGDLLISREHGGAGAEEKQATFIPLPDGRTNADAQSELPAQVITAASAFDAVALALDSAAPPADSDTGSTTGVAAEAPEPPAENAALAPEAADVSLDSTPVAAESFPWDAAESSSGNAASTENTASTENAISTEKAVLAPDATAALPDTAAVPDLAAVTTADAPADAAEVPADGIALAPDAATALPDQADVMAAGLADEAAAPSTEIVTVAPDAAAPSAESAGPVAHPAPVAASADAAPLADDPAARPSSSSDDLRVDALLMKLLRRLKPN